jgi:hypothetical protein
VHEHIFAAFIALDEAKALRRVEKLDHAAAFANDLGRHAAITAAATATAARAAEAATAAGARSTTIAAAEAATTAAKAAAISTAAVPVTTAAAAEAITAATSAACKWIETFFSEAVPLVAPTAATSSIETHKPSRTFASPH